MEVRAESIGGPSSARPRSQLACPSCRRLKARCVYEVDGQPPCVACIKSGKQESCILPVKGTSKVDRAPRGLRKRRRKDEAGNDVPVENGTDGADDLSDSPNDFTPTLQQVEPFHFPTVPSRAHTPPLPPPPIARSFVSSHAPAQQASYSESAHAAQSSQQRQIEAEIALQSSWRDEEEPTVPDPQLSLLPPHKLVIEACENFFAGYAQLPILHRPTFLDRLIFSPPGTISTFLLLSIISLSARFTPSLVEMYGELACGVNETVKKHKVGELFAERAASLIWMETRSPSLERVQAFCLLSLGDWGTGMGFRSRMLHELGNNMADTIQLGIEGPEHSPIEIEMRRRTRWLLTTKVLTMHHSVHSPGQTSDALRWAHTLPLPSHEEAFAAGVISPAVRLADVLNPSPQRPNCSFLGARDSIIVLWGEIIRTLDGGGTETLDPMPWQPNSLLHSTERKLIKWLESIGPQHKWSASRMFAHRAKNQDQGFCSIFVDFHLIHIAARRQFLPDMIHWLHPRRVGAPLPSPSPPQGVEFWKKMANALISHSFALQEVITCAAQCRPFQTGCAAILGFALYLSSTILNYLRCCPWLCPSRYQEVVPALSTSVNLLHEMIDVWPICERWYNSLTAQAVMNWPDDGDSVTQTLRASDDINLDRTVGYFRQYASEGASGTVIGGSGLSNASATPPAASPSVAASPSSISAVVVGPPQPPAQQPFRPPPSTTAAATQPEPEVSLPPEDFYNFLDLAMPMAGSSVMPWDTPEPTMRPEDGSSEWNDAWYQAAAGSLMAFLGQ